MTLLELLLTVQNIGQVFGKNLEMTIEQYNLMLNLAQQELFKEFADGYSQGNGVEVDSRVASALAPFKVDKTFSTYTSSMMFGVDGWRLTVDPNDYKYLSAFVASNSQAYPNKVKNIDIVSPAELGERLSNSITYPTDDYPVMVLSSDVTGATRYATFIPKPTALPNIHVLALQKPTVPSLVETITNGVRTQSGSSVPLQFDTVFHVDIVRKILQYLG